MTNLNTKFPLGHVILTAGAQLRLNTEDWILAIGRHAQGDWGECSEADEAENDLSVKEGYRIISAFRDRKNVKFWIITEADRTTTTVLLPEEY